MFSLVTKSLKIVEFEADFGESLNCEFIEVKVKGERAERSDRQIYNPDGRYYERVNPEVVSSTHEILEKRTELAKIAL